MWDCGKFAKFPPKIFIGIYYYKTNYSSKYPIKNILDKENVFVYIQIKDSYLHT